MVSCSSFVPSPLLTDHATTVCLPRLLVEHLRLSAQVVTALDELVELHAALEDGVDRLVKDLRGVVEVLLDLRYLVGRRGVLRGKRM